MPVSQDSINAALRYGGAYAGGAITIVAGIGLISPADVTQASQAIADIVTGLQQATGGFYKLGVVLGPVAGTVFAIVGWKRGTPAAQVAAVSALPEVKAITVSDPALTAAAKAADPQTIVTGAPIHA